MKPLPCSNQQPAPGRLSSAIPKHKVSSHTFETTSISKIWHGNNNRNLLENSSASFNNEWTLVLRSMNHHTVKTHQSRRSAKVGIRGEKYLRQR